MQVMISPCIFHGHMPRKSLVCEVNKVKQLAEVLQEGRIIRWFPGDDCYRYKAMVKSLKKIHFTQLQNKLNVTPKDKAWYDLDMEIVLAVADEFQSQVVEKGIPVNYCEYNWFCLYQLRRQWQNAHNYQKNGKANKKAFNINNTFNWVNLASSLMKVQNAAAAMMPGHSRYLVAEVEYI
ncbi:hypothetical protein BC941DRAFT_455355 [Chlamydoabsidia padenii]|nr:hypothetical protein BC941DRAFT_455355 [Chlamydoabsidia padenii]